MTFLIDWLLAAFAIIIAAYILPGITVSGFFAAFVTAVVIGLINVFVKPLVTFPTLPINILTLGLFMFVINAVLIMLAGAIVPGFSVQSFWSAFLFSLVLSAINYLIFSLSGDKAELTS